MTKLDFEMSVKRALREKKMTQAQLAEKIGVTAAYCSLLGKYKFKET